MVRSSSSSIINIAVIAILLIANGMVYVTGFAPVQRSGVVASYTQLYAVNKKPISGIGGMGGPTKIEKYCANYGGSKSPVKTQQKAKTVAAAKPKVVNKKQTINSSSSSSSSNTPKGVFNQPALSNETPWGKILVAFLNPVRNPNSIFLYLLIIVSVLGKINETK